MLSDVADRTRGPYVGCNEAKPSYIRCNLRMNNEDIADVVEHSMHCK